MSTDLWISRRFSDQTLVVLFFLRGFGARLGITNSFCPKSMTHQNTEIGLRILRLKPT